MTAQKKKCTHKGTCFEHYIKILYEGANGIGGIMEAA